MVTDRRKFVQGKGWMSKPWEQPFPAWCNVELGDVLMNSTVLRQKF